MRISPQGHRAEDAISTLMTTPALMQLLDRGWLGQLGSEFVISDEHYSLLSSGEHALLTIADQIVTLSLELAPLDLASRADVLLAITRLFSSSTADVELVAVADGDELFAGGGAA